MLSETELLADKNIKHAFKKVLDDIAIIKIHSL